MYSVAVERDVLCCVYFSSCATPNSFFKQNIYEHPRPPGGWGVKVFVVNLLYDIINTMDTTRYSSTYHSSDFAGDTFCVKVI